MPTAIAALTLLAASTAVALLLPRWWAVVAVLVCGAAWVVANGPLEGPVLYTVSTDHGLTAADLLAPAAVVLATARWALHRRGSLRAARRLDA